MPRSLANGDYSMFLAVESSSRPDSWYRVLIDRSNGNYSCDCPPWIFKQNNSSTTDDRGCSHTEFAQSLARLSNNQQHAPLNATVSSAAILSGQADANLIAVQEQWPGIRGDWHLEDRRWNIGGKPYAVHLLQLHSGNGDDAQGLVAFSTRHDHTDDQIKRGIAGWAGYAVAAEIARIGGFPLAGQPPEHFKVSSRTSTRTRRQTPSTGVVAPRIGLGDILRIGEHPDLGDGLIPSQRAENTLRLFMGETLYQQLETQHFLDISSVRHPQRVYRLRRDPGKQRERRVRVFENGRYVHDYCIVRAQTCPEADWYLSCFLGLMSDEQTTISVVSRHNIFSPHSDDYYHRDEETVPALWRPKVV